MRDLITKEVLTVKGEVTKDGGEQVHDEHGCYGNVGNCLHAFLGWTARGKQIFTLTYRRVQYTTVIA